MKTLGTGIVMLVISFGLVKYFSYNVEASWLEHWWVGIAAAVTGVGSVITCGVGLGDLLE